MGQTPESSPAKRRQRFPKRPIERPGQNGFNYRPQYGLVLVCDDEAHQQRLYGRLAKQGLRPKVVCV